MDFEEVHAAVSLGSGAHNMPLKLFFSAPLATAVLSILLLEFRFAPMLTLFRFFGDKNP